MQKVKNKLFILLMIIITCVLVSCRKENGNEPNEETPVHTHELIYFAESLRTCNKDGVKEHWYCAGCNKYFLKEDANEDVEYDELITLKDEHIDLNNDFLCDYGCGHVFITSADLENIFNNLSLETNLLVEINDFVMASTTLFYTENDFSYFLDEYREEYTYDNFIYEKVSGEWTINELEVSPSYDLGYFFDNLCEGFKFSSFNDISIIECDYGHFTDRTGIEFTNSENVRIVVFLNDAKDSFDGFLVRDEYNNYIIECVIEKGIKDEYRNTLIDVIEELKHDRCINETCNGRYLNGFCDVCDSYQLPNLVSGVYDLNQDTVIDDVFEITNAGELYYFSDFVNAGNINACAILLNDIIINEDVVSKNEKVFGTYKLNEGTFRTWKPIGYIKGLDILEYDGIFDGNNHFISGIYLDDELFDGAALFAVANPYALIKNLTVKDIYLNGNKWTSGLVGSIEGTIYNCSVKEAHISGNYFDSYTGGIAGSAIEGTISKCFVEEAEISGINLVGGIVGAISSKSVIENTYSSAYVYGGEYVGGIVGRSGASTTSNSYNIGYVNYGLSDKINVGSICGGFYGGSTFLNCYYLEGTHSVGVYENRTNFEITEATLNSFENGEIAYLLQNGCIDQIWGQKLSLDDKELYPVFGMDKVIKVTNEETGEITYINE